MVQPLTYKTRKQTAATDTPASQRLHYLFLNLGHLLDHLCLLIFATVAALALHSEWQLEYGALIPYATPGFVAFGAGAIPAGWFADRWRREPMLALFFVGMGLSTVACAWTQTPLQMAMGLFMVGLFASIYHPVGIALLLSQPGARAIHIAGNGVWGNLGVAIAALLTGFLLDRFGWRIAFVVPGVVSTLLGIGYFLLFCRRPPAVAQRAGAASRGSQVVHDRQRILWVLSIVLLTTALGGLVYQSTTFALPRVLAERANHPDTTASTIGWLAFFVFSVGSSGQLIVGWLLDRIEPRLVFAGAATLQVLFFTLMIGASGVFAIICATGFMLAAFGQIPINDVLVGRVIHPEWRSRILAVRYSVTISVMALSIPLIAFIHHHYGFTRLFVVLSITALLILCCALALPARLDQRASG